MNSELANDVRERTSGAAWVAVGNAVDANVWFSTRALTWDSLSIVTIRAVEWSTQVALIDNLEKISYK